MTALHPQPSSLATQVSAATQAVAEDAAPRILTSGSEYQTFTESNALWVDKTAALQDLVDMDRVYLYRPQGFGKSLLLSLLTELYMHGTTRVAHLAIAKRWHEPQCPVLRLSFRGLHDPATFEQELCARWRRACYDAGFHEIYDFIPECQRFRLLASRTVNQVLQGQKVVVLIDDWDDPILSNLHDRATVEANVKHLFAVYVWLREGDFLRFLLFTGECRYKIASLFTADNFCDCSLKSRFAALLGYTEEELRTYFAPYLARSAALCHMSEEALIEQLRRHYGGFCFDEEGQVRVYSPWSINCFFAQLAQAPERAPLFRSFWQQDSHKASVLRTIMKTCSPAPNFFDAIKAKGIELTWWDIKEPCGEFDEYPFETLLLQAGYLTIQEKLLDERDKFGCFSYRCNFTNLEVESLFTELFAAYVRGQKWADSAQRGGA